MKKPLENYNLVNMDFNIMMNEFCVSPIPLLWHPDAQKSPIF